ncbi:MAG TPA: DUF1304 domain-containing protein [Gammaproteobacteria bacterium]|nr:DUF1304 domain-containing protein [Gammaproteobacteria bacterium]
MNLTSQVFALLAAVLHVLIFCLESLWFMRPSVHKRFGAVTIADAEARRLFAFNQGFYNLFLAVGIFVGLVLLHIGNVTVGKTLVLFNCACMLGAGAVLFLSAGPKMLRAAAMQAVSPFLALVFGLLI